MKNFWLGFSWGAIICLVVISVFTTNKITLALMALVIYVMVGFFLFLVIAGVWPRLKGQNGKNPKDAAPRPGEESSEANGRPLPPGHIFHSSLKHIVCVDEKCKCGSVKAVYSTFFGQGHWEFTAPDFPEDIKTIQDEFDRVHNQRFDRMKNASIKSQSYKNQPKSDNVPPMQGSVGQGDGGSPQ